MPNKPLPPYDITQNHPEWERGWEEKRNSTKSLVHAPRENRCEMKHETPIA